jgi:hypothetical protein
MTSGQWFCKGSQARPTLCVLQHGNSQCSHPKYVVAKYHNSREIMLEKYTALHLISF